MRLRDLFLFWLPLFGSWILLTAEGPLVTTVISRLPDAAVMLAAQGIMVGVSVLIESPIINILSTSTAKVKDFPTYALVRRFNVHLLIALTILTLIFGYTPVFDWLVIRLMGTPENIAEYVRIGLQINILWSAAIGWRRFLQGVLIKFDRTRAVAVGTAVRLAVSALTAVSLAFLTDASGAVVGAWTLQLGVISEAIYATWAVQPLFKKELLPSNAAADLSYIELFWFHLPLASTSVLMLLVQPIAVFTLARLSNPTLSLAAWPVLFQLLLLARAPALATPEVIIARNDSAENRATIRRFVMILTAVVAVSMIVFTLTPLKDFYFDTFLNVPADIGALARSGLQLSMLFPALTLVVMAMRGFLISNQRTNPVNVGMFINLVLSVIILLAGVPLRWDGIFTAAVAINVAVVGELLYLLTQARTTNMFVELPDLVTAPAN